MLHIKLNFLKNNIIHEALQVLLYSWHMSTTFVKEKVSPKFMYMKLII